MAVQLRLRLRSGSAGLFEDKKRWRRTDACVLCNGGKVKDGILYWSVRSVTASGKDQGNCGSSG